MITKNPMQLKAFIKNKAAEKHISAQLVMQNYMQFAKYLQRFVLSKLPTMCSLSLLVSLTFVKPTITPVSLHRFTFEVNHLNSYLP